jgi:hypothetical protein
MPTFKVCLTGNFTNEVDVEVEPIADGTPIDDADIEAAAISLFESEYSVSGSNWSHDWDYVNIDSIEEIK